MRVVHILRTLIPAVLVFFCVTLTVTPPAMALDLGFELPDTDALMRKVRRTLGFETEEEKNGIAYEVRIDGLDGNDVKDVLKASSQLIALNDRPARTRANLRRRAEEDVDRFAAALRSEGYYESHVDFEIEAAEDIAKDDVPVVVLTVTAGPQYRLQGYDIRYNADSATGIPHKPETKELGIASDMAARAPDIVSVEGRIKDWFLKNGYPFVEIGARRAVIDKDKDSMTVTLNVETGPLTPFGTTNIGGNTNVEKSYIQNAIAWKESEPFDQRKLDATRRKLTGSGLFASVAVKPAEKPNADGSIPIIIDVEEQAHRTVGFGFSYATDLGFGADAFWEHRNILGEGEKLRFDLKLAEIEQSLSTRFEQPNFYDPAQTLIADGSLRNRTTDGFDEMSATASVSIVRQLSDHWRIGVGIAPEYSIIEDNEGEREFFLLGGPVTVTRDDTDDLLSPTRGTRLDFNATPYVGWEDEEPLSFVSLSATAAGYYAFDDAKRYIFATRAKIGSIVGEETDSIPATKRFFAGGGGSIRGFEFQSVGPEDDNNDPLGGRSVVEVNAEMRIRIADSFGIVPFVDGGTVFDNAVADFDESFRWAVGIGARYYTPIGPLRVDIATPLRRRSDEDRVLLYIGLGQAF